MDAALIILIVLLALAVVAAYARGRLPLVWTGVKQTGSTLKSMWFRILLGMALGGFIQVLVPNASIAEWLGPSSGLKGILIGSYIGFFVSGGPYVIMPVIASIYEAGAGPGPIIALLTGGMLSIQGLFAWYIPILGVRLSIAKYIVALILPPIIGLAGGALYQMLNSA